VSRHSRALGALSSIVVGAAVAVLAMAGPVAAEPDYPSWDDVLAARENQAATEAAITEIEGILGGLQNQAAELERDAQVKGEAYNAALMALDAAAAKSDRLSEQADAAQRRADESSRKAGQLAAQLGRTGGGDITLALLVSSNPDDLLNQLGAMTQVSAQAAAIYRQALVDQNASEALTAQAEVAEAERGKLEDAAGVALTAAQSAADDANARLAEQQAASEQLTEQLAVLKGTTAQAEQGYLAGLAAQPPAPQQPADPPPGASPPGDPGPSPDTGAAAGAIAFAYAQIGDAYAWAGSGPDAWDCSGLTQAAYASVGVYIGAHLVSSQYYTMANQGRLVWYENMQPGDLIFYNNGGFYHMSIYVGGGQMIEAPRDGIPVRLTAVRYLDMMDYVGRPTG
jgi:cell wall-associated NlpC family hydrolase